MHPSYPPPSESQGGGDITQGNLQLSREESDEWKTVRTKRNRPRRVTNQGSCVLPSPVFPFLRLKTGRFTDNDPPAKGFTDKSIITQGLSTKPRNAEGTKEKPEV